MRRVHILFYTVICSATLLCGSCKKDFLNTTPLAEFSEGAVWADPVLVQSFINNIYKNLMPSPRHWHMWDGAFVDELTSWYSYVTFHNSLITPDYMGEWQGETWPYFYKNIRACNVFFDRIDELEASEQEKNDMKGQVYFLRAFNYHMLVKMYGGVPIITKAYTLTDSFLVARNTYEECINFIVEDCDAAAGLLPEVQADAELGQATKGAALSLKSKMLLYAASDLHNTNKFGGFSNPELLQYQGGDRTARWTAAKNAAKAVMDMNLYDLYKADPAPGDSITQNMIDRYLSKNNVEDIWTRFFLARTFESNDHQDSGPNGFNGFAHNTPIGHHADAYEMDNGTPFDWDNPMHAAAPYKNRDPRFYADILYEGAPWRMRPGSLVGVDPIGVIKIGNKEVWRNNQMEIEYGLDGQNGPLLGYIGTQTGYYLRKFIDPGVEAGKFGLDVPWRYFRYAEILLNYVEACIELGEEGEALTYLNKIRRRAGMPDVSASGAELRERYRNERRIELAFEEHRFYDVRRWMIAPEVYKPTGGVHIIYKLNPDHTTSSTPTITPIEGQMRSWNDKTYFFPVPRDEMNKNILIVQNPGYN